MEVSLRSLPPVLSKRTTLKLGNYSGTSTWVMTSLISYGANRKHRLLVISPGCRRCRMVDSSCNLWYSCLNFGFMLSSMYSLYSLSSFSAATAF